MDNAKFFDKPLPNIMTCHIDYEVDQLRQCLESEGILITFSDTVKLLDIYCRLSGLDRNVDVENGIQAIWTWCGVVSFNDVWSARSGEDVTEVVRNAINCIDDLVDDKYKLSNIDIVLNNTDIILKEYAIFMNETLDAIYNLCEKTENCMGVSLQTTDMETGNTFIIRSKMIHDIDEFIIEISSQVLSDKTPNTVAIILNTFSENDQKIFNENYSMNSVTDKTDSQN